MPTVLFNTYVKADPKVIEILDAVFHRLDTESADRPALRKYRDSLDYELDEDNFVVIVDKDNVCENAKQYIANAIKKGVKIDEGGDPGTILWSRDSYHTPSFVTNQLICVGDCYKLYDYLKDRDVAGKTYATLRKFQVTVKVGDTVLSVEEVIARNGLLAIKAAKAQAAQKLEAGEVIEIK